MLIHVCYLIRNCVGAAIRESRKWDVISTNNEADFDCPLFPWMVHGTQLHDFD